MAITCTSADSHLYGAGGSLLNTADPFSINVWMNCTWNGGARLSFVGMYNGTPPTGTPSIGSGLQIGTGAGAGEISCWVYGGTIMIQSAAAAMTAFNGQWVMTTYTWDGTNHRLYVNGASITAPTTTAFTAAQMTQVYINGFPPTGTTGETANFSVDSYTTFRRALSPEEVLTLFNNQGARGGITSSMGIRYEFDEGSNGSTVTSVIDVAGGGNTILPTGAVNTVTYTYSVGGVQNIANTNTRPVL